MVDVCRRVDVDTLMNSQMWGYNDFHLALLKHSDQVGLIVTSLVHVHTLDICVNIPTQLETCRLQHVCSRLVTLQ